MPKKIADKGSSEAFLRKHLDTSVTYCILWPYRLTSAGYGLAVINGKQMSASRWMCVLAHGEPTPPRDHAAHLCGNPSCVNPNHLKWKTHRENMLDRLEHGTENIGENNGRTTLTEEDVRAIRAAPPALKPLMEKYGMSKHGISKIRGRKRWGHVK